MGKPDGAITEYVQWNYALGMDVHSKGNLMHNHTSMYAPCTSDKHKKITSAKRKTKRKCQKIARKRSRG